MLVSVLRCVFPKRCIWVKFWSWLRMEWLPFWKPCLDKGIGVIRRPITQHFDVVWERYRERRYMRIVRLSCKELRTLISFARLSTGRRIPTRARRWMLGVSVKTFERKSSAIGVWVSAVRLWVSKYGLWAKGRAEMGNFADDMCSFIHVSRKET